MYFILHPITSINHLIARLIADQVTLVISILFFLFLCANYKKPSFQNLDNNVQSWALASNGGFFKNHAEDFAIFGNAVFHILFCVVLSIIFLIAKHTFSTVIAVIFTLIFSWGLNRLMKLIYRRERPGNIQNGIRKRMSYCFPSGHVMASIGIYFFCAMILQGLMPFLPWFIIALFLSVSVIMSRIYLGHHYFTDILGGIASGIFCLNVSIWFYFLVSLI